jgi:predicted metalloprotease
MQWRGRRTSDNIEDRRRSGPARAGGIGVVGLILVLLAGVFFGVDITPFLQGGGGVAQAPAPSGPNAIDDAEEEFVGVVLAETEDVWSTLFTQSGLDYVPPRLVLYAGGTVSACGAAQSAMGPFYCPNDQTVYLDTDFFRVMVQQLGTEGEFAQAYVIAHEVGHHVQNLLGTLGQVNAQRNRVSRADSNALSVRVELQADCYAGI